MYICCSCILNPHHTVHKSHIMECTERLVPLKYGGNDSIKHLFWCTNWIAGKFAQQYFQEILQFKTFIFKRVSKSPTIRSDMNYFQSVCHLKEHWVDFPDLAEFKTLLHHHKYQFSRCASLPSIIFQCWKNWLCEIMRNRISTSRIDYAKYWELFNNTTLNERISQFPFIWIFAARSNTSTNWSGLHTAIRAVLSHISQFNKHRHRIQPLHPNHNVHRHDSMIRINYWLS